MKALRKPYARAWGEEWACGWKLEVQLRGAPHVHLLCTPPHGTAKTTGERFAVWLFAAWADVFTHPEPEQRRRHELAGTALDYAEDLRAIDPRRVAAYFTKHGLMAAEEYQHDVPPQWHEPGKGPGRFWGVWGPDRATRTLQVCPEEASRPAASHGAGLAPNDAHSRRGSRAPAKLPAACGYAALAPECT